MKQAFRRFSFGLLLISSVAGVSGSASADRALATASATIVAPASIYGTLLARGPAFFVSGVTGALSIRVSRGFLQGADGDGTHFVTSELQVELDESCRAANGTSCFKLISQKGLLAGDPVSGIYLEPTDGSPASDEISATVTYN